MYLPGTTIEVTELQKGSSRTMFDGIFATGGITLSQVAIMTGLEPYAIQNWVKRGFVSSPKKRVYTKDQFARIVIINMLRESLQLDNICVLIAHINGTLNDESDDLIYDSELYHTYVDMVAHLGGIVSDERMIREAASAAVDGYAEPVAGAKERLVSVLTVMAYAHYAAHTKRAAEELLEEIKKEK